MGLVHDALCLGVEAIAKLPRASFPRGLPSPLIDDIQE